MKNPRKTILLTFALIGATAPGTADEQPSVSTKGGFSIESADGAFSFEAGGRIMWDTDSFDGVLNRANDGDRRLNSDLRRSRLELDGSVLDDWDYSFHVDLLESGGASLHTIGVGYSGFEPFDVFIGRTKEPFGLEELSSSKALASIERNYFTEATDADSQPHFGVRLDGKVGQVGWSAGFFNPSGSPKKSDGGDRFAFTGRLFTAPVNEDGRTVHLGAAYTNRNIDTPIEQKGFGLDIAESGGVLDSSTWLTRDDSQWGLEGLYIDGPVSLQAEVFNKDMDIVGSPDGDVTHFYIQGTYTLTGERRGYKADSGTVDIIQPDAGDIAIELVAKIDQIELDVGGTPTEEVTGILAGVNFYLNRNVKLMANLISVDSKNIAAPGDDDDALVVSTRVQIAF